MLEKLKVITGQNTESGALLAPLTDKSLIEATRDYQTGRLFANKEITLAEIPKYSDQLEFRAFLRTLRGYLDRSHGSC